MWLDVLFPASAAIFSAAFIWLLYALMRAVRDGW